MTRPLPVLSPRSEGFSSFHSGLLPALTRAFLFGSHMDAGHSDHDYQMGLRDGKIKSLEDSLSQITIDLAKLKIMIWMLYGAIALVQFLPDLRGLFNGVQ